MELCGHLLPPFILSPLPSPSLHFTFPPSLPPSMTPSRKVLNFSQRPTQSTPLIPWSSITWPTTSSSRRSPTSSPPSCSILYCLQEYTSVCVHVVKAGCHLVAIAQVVEHRQLKSEAPGSIPGGCQFFSVI